MIVAGFSSVANGRATGRTTLLGWASWCTIKCGCDRSGVGGTMPWRRLRRRGSFAAKASSSFAGRSSCYSHGLALERQSVRHGNLTKGKVLTSLTMARSSAAASFCRLSAVLGWLECPGCHAAWPLVGSLVSDKDVGRFFYNNPEIRSGASNKALKPTLLLDVVAELIEAGC